jgi:hypothetical protein
MNNIKMLNLENNHFNYSNLNVKINQKTVILNENRSNFLRSERLLSVFCLFCLVTFTHAF